MALRITKCQICQKTLKYNGLVGLKNEVINHFRSDHPKELEEWNNFNQERLAVMIKERQRLIEKAIEMIDDPSLLVSEY